MEKAKIGEYLVKGGSITQGQLEVALARQEKEGGRIGEILIRLGFIHDKVLIDALTLQAEDCNN